VHVGLKQRLIGAAVLIGIGIIAWSLLFDPSQAGRFSRSSEIPPAPEFEPVQIPRPSPAATPPRIDFEARNRAQLAAQQAADETPAEPGPDEAAPAPDESSAAPPVPAEQVSADQDLPPMWAVQVGSFSDLTNAREFKQRLEEAGYHVIVQRIDGAQGRMTRLIVDPTMTRRSAERLQTRLDADFGTRSVVIRYYPG
jgi:DedD protein